MKSLALPALAAVLLLASAHGADAPPVVLRNTLPVEGPAVQLNPRLGFHYHPGAAVALEGVVRPAGEEFHSITVQEGAAELGPRYASRGSFGRDTPSNFLLPLRAPAGGARLTLGVWSHPPGSERSRALFSGTLANELKPVGRNEKVVLQVGRSPAPAPAHWRVATVEPTQLPEQAWMYDNLDIVLLAASGLSRSSPAALQALRNWVCGGGSLLIASLDPKVLQEAVKAGLTPLPPDTPELQRDLGWWSKHAGLKDRDFARDTNGTLVFADYRLGFGGGVIFFQNSDPQTLLRFWPQALAREPFSRERPRTDERIWATPFDFFASGTIAPARRRQGLWWAGVGGLCLVILLAYAATLKTRYMSAGLALGGVVAFTAALGRVFEAPEGVVSRIEVAEYSADGRGLRKSHFAYVEGLQEAGGLSVHAPADATLLELHAQDSELDGAGTELQAGSTGLSLQFRAPHPAPLPPLFLARRGVGANWAPGAAGPTHGIAERGTLLLPSHPDLTGAECLAPGVVLVEDGAIALLRHPPNWPGRELVYEPAERMLNNVQKFFPALKEQEAAACAAALDWACKSCPPGRRFLITMETFDHGAPGAEEFLRVEGARLEPGRQLRLRIIEVQYEAQ